MKSLKTYFDKTEIRHVLFWIGIFLYFTLSANIDNYNGSYLQLFESYIIFIAIQILIAYTCLYYLVPNFLNKGKTGWFVLWLIILLFVMYAMYIYYRIYYYDVRYFDYYSPIVQHYAKQSFWERLLSFSVFLSKSIKFLTPTALLLMFRFYKNQQNYLKLNEQKKIAELTALKNQLNPHFLFNTLNNLYALAIKKSDHAPEVIEKLSDILDYMLYRCNSKFVSIQKEIELIENYIALEKIRYGNRVRISFKNNSTEDSKIAPLLLLTFIENAFKHGVTQELKEAFISITISSDSNHIIFNIENSKSTISVENKNQRCIGLSNVQKQLDLLYGDDYSLDIKEESDKYCVRLILEAK
ncbi:sensor histidine kinase [Aquimarina sp. AU58]|uniref:sensor histidine kinase n=1 Tax=Aquimarina sp. AU58 TaxID=1874112 RepID=UPI000D6E00E7|nr:histidine kinase [Aquimarina sp. AU58]